MFGGTYELDGECIEAESLGPHQGEFSGETRAAKGQDASSKTRMAKQKIDVPARHFAASKFEIWIHIHCPEELCDQRFVEDLFHGDFIPFAPSHCDSRIQIIDLGSAQSNCLQVVLHTGIDLSLCYDCLFGIYGGMDPAEHPCLESETMYFGI